MKHIYKEYNQAFLLEPTKLRRLIDTIHERLADHHQHTTQQDAIEVFLTGNRREEMTTLDQVLAIDNSRRHKIKRIVILCSASTPGTARPEHEVQVDFASPKLGPSSGGGTKVVAISVRSDAAAWASRTLSEVEEQVERTWLYHARHLVALFGLFLAVMIVLASQFVSFHFPPRADMWWLSNTNFDRIEAMLKERPILTDEDLREVSTMQLRNILDSQRPQSSSQTSQATRTLFLAVPLSVVLTCIVILLTTCYPSAVFLWGDEVERYANIVQRRKLIWGFIVGISVIGVLSRFFYEGLSSWLPRQS